MPTDPNEDDVLRKMLTASAKLQVRRGEARKHDVPSTLDTIQDNQVQGRDG